MSFQIERGLFYLDFTDHHAILGVPVDADVKDIRKRYLKIARRLHPDSCISESENDRQLASQFLSKLVNPAWEKLSQEKDRIEYGLLLKLKGQQAIQKRNSIELRSGLAQQLLASNNPDHFYQASLKDLTSKQYDHLDQTEEIINQISELNLAYLMRKEGSGAATSDEPKKPIFTGSNIPDSKQAVPKNPTNANKPSEQPKRESFAEQYYRRAEALYGKGNFAQAILELRDALKIEPNNSQCHSLLGVIHLRQNQLPMARVHINKALETDPQNEMAVKAKQKLEELQNRAGKTTGAASSTKAAPQKAPTKPSKPDDKSGGLFGLFGGKKK